MGKIILGNHPEQLREMYELVGGIIEETWRISGNMNEAEDKYGKSRLFSATQDSVKEIETYIDSLRKKITDYYEKQNDLTI